MPSPGSDNTQISILYVDDEPPLLKVGRLFLERSNGVRVNTLDKAHDALCELETRSYDVIVSDYQMPGMDGVAFLKTLRERGDTTPFILFTGKGREEVVIEAFEAGADFYIQKGGDPRSQFAELERKIRKAVDLHRAEKASRKSEEKYRTLVDRSSQMLFLHDLNGRILDVNQKTIKTTGYSMEELLSMNVVDIDPDAKIRTDIQWLWKDSPVMEDRIFQVRHRRKDGLVYPAEVHATKVAISGEPCIMALATDITQRKQEEEALRESEEMFRGIIDNLQDIYYRSDAEGMITMVNHSAASILGVASADEIVGRAASDFWAYPEERNEFLRQVRAEGKVSDYEATLKKADGILLPVSVSCRLLFDNSGNAAGIEGIIRDITRRKKAEEALRESEEKFRALVEHSLEGILIADFSGNILFMNQSAGGIIDVADYKGLVGRRNVLDFVAPESKEDCLRDFNQVAQGIDAYLVLYQLVTDAKRTTWVECIGKRMDFQGFPAMLVSIRDITERKLTEFNLAAIQQRLKEVHQLANIGTWDWIMETDTMTWSEELYAIAGRDPALPALNYKEHQPLYTPASWDRLKQAIHRTLETGEPFRLELEMARPDGTIRNVHALGRQSLDINGNCIGLHGAVQDITDRKRTEKELQKVSLYTRGLIEASLDPLVTISPEGLITDVNHATEKITGIPRKKLIGSDFADYFTDPEQAGRGYAEAFRSGFVKDYPLTIRHRSGRTTDVLYNASVYADQSGTVQGVFAAARDITEQRIAEEALQTANHKLQILSSITRHDILNKIMILQAYLDLTIEEIDDPNLSAYLSEIDRAGNEIQRQIEFTRTYEELGVKKAAWHEVEELITEIPYSTIPVYADCGEYLILADPMIERVFSNLMENTLRHAEGAGWVEVQCEEQNGDLLITWEDDGPGVPDDQKEEIFKQGVGRNTGFGLFLAREILAITGITIHETGVHGEGARFEIRVPAGVWKMER
ncbi:PAS domain S-box protein [Methanocalculus chunghsingensis]|uniref:PAS domain S-box protein n=1 Tax=Methanocalculus chunghsingensis TaxID=156457 RepID=UPI001B8D3645|nr:PAS domain S-box protein [Methanocalculus chunghsingensis]